MSVSTKTEIIIKDACVLFDLMDLGLLPSFYQLDIVIFTTPEVLAEITDDTQLLEVTAYIQSERLKIEQSGDYETISAIVYTNPGLSFTDASVLDAATRRSAAILSSDKSLRNESQRRGLTVRGVLWILEELYKQSILPIDVVLMKLSTYPEVNKRAPKAEIAKLISRLEKTAYESDHNKQPIIPRSE